MYTMKTNLIIIVICLIFFVCGSLSKRQFSFLLKHNPPPPTGSKRNVGKVILGYYTQKLDHFDSDNTATWYQRFYVYNHYQTNKNVAFLMLGGEGEIDENSMRYGTWITSARKYGALLFQLEHRFYGESQPLPDISTQSLKYLSSEQALVDAAEFIQAMNVQYSLASDVKWIVFGGSYSGSLAAWLRLKYPELVYGAVASSGPLLAKLDFSDYFQVVIDDLNNISEKCVTSLTTAMKHIDDLLQNPSETEVVSSMFNLCEPIEGLDLNHPDVLNFYLTISGTFASTAQYNGQDAVQIEDLCAVMCFEELGTEVERLQLAVKLVNGIGCHDVNYQSYVNFLRNPTRVKDDDRQWTYQTCAEFGWYQTTNRADNIFGQGVTVDYYTKLCADVFGQEFNQSFTNDGIDLTNYNYGALNINVSNVVYVYGSVDPWHAVGPTETTNPDSPFILVKGTSHCADMNEANGPEVPELTKAKEQIDKLIGEWLGFN